MRQSSNRLWRRLITKMHSTHGTRSLGCRRMQSMTKQTLRVLFGIAGNKSVLKLSKILSLQKLKERYLAFCGSLLLQISICPCHLLTRSLPLQSLGTISSCLLFYSSGVVSSCLFSAPSLDSKPPHSLFNLTLTQSHTHTLTHSPYHLYLLL